MARGYIYVNRSERRFKVPRQQEPSGHRAVAESIVPQQSTCLTSGVPQLTCKDPA